MSAKSGDERLRYFVYRLHASDGEVLYVGRSCDVPGRIRTHVSDVSHPDPRIRQSKPEWVPLTRWVSMEGPFTWTDVVRRERAEIERLQPRGNVALTSRDPRPSVARMSAWRASA